MTRYKQRADCEGFEVPSGAVYKIACCDCGLVHDFVFVSEDGKPIGIAARRNNRATAQRRRKVDLPARKAEVYAATWHRLVVSLGCMFGFDATGSAEEVAASASAVLNRLAAPQGE